MARILCVEDEAALRRILAEELRDAGFEVIEADDGLQALDLIAEMRPDMVLCDVTMPGLSGYDVLARLRERADDLADIPFVFLSALADRKDVIAGRQLGADDYLTKPIDLEMLLATVETRLARVRRLEARMEAERVAAAAQAR
ncbi:MAG: response regulator, partial [Caenispirillum sp.]|nr:response regulator [Caenispirillum sp.]